MKFFYLLVFCVNSLVFHQTTASYILNKSKIEKITNNTTEQTLDFTAYIKNNEEFNQFLTDFNKDYIELTKIYEIGRSKQNQPIKVLMISNSIGERKMLKPSVKLIANQFGNEVLSTQLLIYLSKFLLENYSKNELIRDLINSVDLHFLFVMNPDAFDRATEGECKSNRKKLQTKFNKFPDRYDRNSDMLSNYEKYSDFWLKEGLPYGMSNNKSDLFEPEVKSVVTWSLNNQYVLSLNLHSGDFMAVLYPFSRFKAAKNTSLAFEDPFSNLTPDNKLFQALGYSYAMNHPSMKSSACNPLKNFENTDRFPVINSAEFSQVNGSMQDYNYFFANCYELSVHISCCAYPKSTELKSYWEENKVPLVNYLTLAHMGVKGLIIDSQTRKPLFGVFVKVSGIDKITISNEYGEYFRPLAAGPYRISFSIIDYVTVTVNVLVNNILNSASVLNVEMKRNLEEFKNIPIANEMKAIEAKNNLNKNFTKKFKELKKDFESVPKFKYHDYDEMIGYLFYYHEKYPNMTWLYRIGPPNGKSGLGFVISAKNPDRHELLRPEFKFVANSYAEDYIGRELLLLLIKHLLEKYGKNKEITELVDSTRIHIVPSLDPSSFENDYEKYKNKTVEERDKESMNKACILDDSQNNRIDLIYPDDASTKKFIISELIEMQNVANWLDDNAFLLSGTLYDGQLLARIPYNTQLNKTKNSTTLDDKLFRDLAKSYTMYNEKMKNSKGCDNEKCGDYLKFNGSNPNKEGVIVNGVDWTNQTNTLQDWHYKISGYIDINFFISCTRKPNASKLFDYWKENRRSFINYMKQVHRGVKGVLIDEKTKKFIRNDMIIEIDNKKPVIVNSQGDYYRLLLPGTYNLTISIEEYDVSTQTVVVGDKVEILNFTLKRSARGLVERPNLTIKDLFPSAHAQLEFWEKKSKKPPNQPNSIKSTSNLLTKTIGFILLTMLVSYLVYHGFQLSKKKLNLRRGFHQLFDDVQDDILLMPLDKDQTFNDKNEVIRTD